MNMRAVFAGEQVLLGLRRWCSFDDKIGALIGIPWSAFWHPVCINASGAAEMGVCLPVSLVMSIADRLAFGVLAGRPSQYSCIY